MFKCPYCNGKMNWFKWIFSTCCHECWTNWMKLERTTWKGGKE